MSVKELQKKFKQLEILENRIKTGNYSSEDVLKLKRLETELVYLTLG